MNAHAGNRGSCGERGGQQRESMELSIFCKCQNHLKKVY